jgi:phosphoglycolate phosphatase-like HAD superfamily hydrolase
MLKSLYPRVDWTAVRAVGFDMDGTLYDEGEFIAQAYRPIAQLIAQHSALLAQAVFEGMFRRWVEKGSSYPHIFAEALADAGVSGELAQRRVAECVAMFRGFQPTLTLPRRVQTILDVMHQSHLLFLISDGAAALQRRKFECLGLSRWFPDDRVGFSGALEPRRDKPDVRVLGSIAGFAGQLDPREVVFFGDRPCDAAFAANAGFQFVPVRCMYPAAITEGSQT